MGKRLSGKGRLCAALHIGTCNEKQDITFTVVY